jgi:hypothetical protein
MQYSSNVEPDDLVARDANGVVAVSSALRCTLYLRRGFEVEQRRAMRDVINRYVDMAKDGLRWLMPTKAGALALNASNIADALDTKLASIENSEDTWELHVHGGEQAQAASDLGIEVSLRRRWEAEPPHKHLSFISFAFRSSGSPTRSPSFRCSCSACARC